MAPPELVAERGGHSNAYLALVGLENAPSAGFLEPDSYFATFMDALSHAHLHLPSLQTPPASGAPCPAEERIGPLIQGAVKELDSFSRTYTKMAHEAQVLAKLVAQMGENGSGSTERQQAEHERIIREIELHRTELEARCRMSSYDNCSLRHLMNLQAAKTAMVEEEARRLSENNRLLLQQLRAAEGQMDHMRAEGERYRRSAQQSMQSEVDKARGHIAALEKDLHASRSREAAALQERQGLQAQLQQLQEEVKALQDRNTESLAEVQGASAAYLQRKLSEAQEAQARLLDEARLQHSKQMEDLRSSHARQLEDLREALLREGREGRGAAERELEATRKALLAQLEDKEAQVAQLRARLDASELRLAQAQQGEGRALALGERVRALEEALREKREECEEWRRQVNNLTVFSQSQGVASQDRAAVENRLLHDQLAALERRLRAAEDRERDRSDRQHQPAAAVNAAPAKGPATAAAVTAAEVAAAAVGAVPPPAKAPAAKKRKEKGKAARDVADAEEEEDVYIPPAGAGTGVGNGAATVAPAGGEGKRTTRPRAPGKSLAEPSTPLELREDSEGEEEEEAAPVPAKKERKRKDKAEGGSKDAKREKDAVNTTSNARERSGQGAGAGPSSGAPGRVDINAPYEPPSPPATAAATPATKPANPTTAAAGPAAEEAPGTVTRRRRALEEEARERVGGSEALRQPLRAIGNANVAATAAGRKAAEPPGNALKPGLVPGVNVQAAGFVSGLKRPAPPGEGGAPPAKRKLLKPNPTAHVDSLVLFGKGTSGFTVPKLNLPKK